MKKLKRKIASIIMICLICNTFFTILPEVVLASQIHTDIKQNNKLDTYIGNNSAKTTESIIHIISPEVKGSDVTFRYDDAEAESVSIAGDFNSWNSTSHAMMKNTKGIWEKTISLDSGQHLYKLVINSSEWKNDPLNPLETVGGDQNSQVIVEGLVIEGNPEAVEAGTKVSLMTQGKVYTTNIPEGVSVPVTYATTEDAVIEVNEDGTFITVDPAKDIDSITIEATTEYEEKKFTQAFECKVVKEVKTYTINYYRPNQDFTNWNLWMWADSIDGKQINFTTSVYETLQSSDKKYHFKQATYTVPNDVVKLIMRKGEWETKDGDERKIIMPESEKNVEVWLVEGDSEIYYSLEEALSVIKNNEKFATAIGLEETFIALGIGAEYELKPIVKDQNGEEMTCPVTFTSKDEKVITIKDNKIIAESIGKTTIKLVAAEAELEIEVEVVEKLLPAKVQIKSPDTKVYEGFDIKLEVDIRDQFNQIMLDEKVKWSSSDSSIAEVDENGTVTGKESGITTITASVGDKEATFELEVKKFNKRCIVFEYDRPAGDYTDWNLWVWDTGIKDNRIDFTEDVDGKKVAYIEVGPEAESVGFIIRKGEWQDKDTDTNRFIKIYPDQSVTKVKVKQGEESFETLKQTGVSLDTEKEPKLTFGYRDDILFKSNKMSGIEKAEVEINGQKYPMTYNEGQEWFEYTLDSLEEDKYLYSYFITQDGVTTEVLDNYNQIKENGKSVFEYKQVKIISEALPRAVTSRDNSVISIQAEGLMRPIKNILIDLTEVGGDKIEVSPELMKVSIGIKDSVPAGIKTLPIEIYDTMDNVYKSEVEIEVVPYTGNDFDYDEAVIYFMLTDRFHNGDTSNDDPYNIGYTRDRGSYQGGDFRGIIDKLDYLEELGINTIWINPIVENVEHDVRFEDNPYINSYYGYHGYWAKNFEKLNPHFGTIEELHELIDKAHQRGIKIMVDVVLNHAGYGMNNRVNEPPTGYPTDKDCELFKGMLRDEISTDEVTGQLSGLPDFRTEDPEVRKQLVDWQVAWVETLGKTPNGNSIDFFRIDTVKHVEDETWMHLKNELTAVDSDFKMIGEAFGASLNSDSGYLESGMMDSILDFEFKYIAAQFANGDMEGAQNKLIDRNSKLDNVRTVGNFLSSHDEDGFLFKHVNGDINKFKAAVTLQATVKGQPVIYYGEELGYSGENNYPQYDNRPMIDWKKANTENELLTHYKKVFKAREAYSEVFAKGTHKVIDGNNDVGYTLFEREHNNENVIVGINLGNEKEITIDTQYPIGTVMKDLYSNKTYIVREENTIQLTLPAITEGGSVILVKESKEPAVVTEIIIKTTKAVIKKGEKLALEIEAKDQYGNVMENQKGVWSTSNKHILKVSKKGVVTAKSEGKATITVRVGDVTAEVELTVEQKKDNNKDDNKNDGNDEKDDTRNEFKNNIYKEIKEQWQKIKKWSYDSNIQVKMFEILTHYKKVSQVIESYGEVFAKGTYKVISSNNNLGYTLVETEYKDQNVIVGVNSSKNEQEITIDIPYPTGTMVKDIYSNKNYIVSKENTIKITLPAITDGGLVILISKSKKETEPEWAAEIRKNIS